MHEAQIHFGSFAVLDSQSMVGFGIYQARRITASPDERWLLYSDVEPAADLMLVENFHWPDASH